MDVSALDRPSAKLVVELRLKEITDALQGVDPEADQTANYRALERSLQDQLSIFSAQDEEGDAEDDTESTKFAAKWTASVVSINQEQKVGETVDRNSEGQHAYNEPEPEPYVLCCACSDPYPVGITIQLDCQLDSHTYCHQCVLEFFEISIHKDSTLFPPRCCGNQIPLEICRSFLTDDLIEEIKVKKEELEKENAVFCSDTTCGKLITFI
ncbi:hypothetical protein EK21DRAFT_88709 [Setomelanomma holmii]|uniref:RING-type domain-containing protein n=1 Tax=Setomelanomma holmii TaxID=210430 RepID=A0A9P4H9K1_9PLEO|nr:hypothetical protein EK21DRAFT_88709 [Setomelanomma holmii]